MIKHSVMTREGIVEKELTPLKVIRLKCWECSNWQPNEILTCHMEDCPLWVFRMGKNPSIKRRKLTEGEKDTLRAQLVGIKKQTHTQV